MGLIIKSGGTGRLSTIDRFIFNNTFNTRINAQNTTWYTNSSANIVLPAPLGSPNVKCLQISQGFKTNLNPDPTFSASSLYSVRGFGDVGMIDLTGSYTIEFWFHVTNISNIYNTASVYGAGTFYFIRGCGADPIEAAMKGDRSIVWFVQNERFDPTRLTLTTAPSLWNLNSWNHLALVNNRILGNRTIFLNGINVASGSGNKSWNGDNSNLYGTPTANYQWGIGHDFDNGYLIYINNMRWTQRPRYSFNFTPVFANERGIQL